MTKISFWLFFALLSTLVQAQRTVRVLVQNYSFNNRPEKGVLITPLTGGGNAGSTNDAGIFDIKLSNAKPGDRFDLLVEKPEYQILGSDARIFKYAVPNNEQEYISISIVKTSQFNAVKAGFELSIEKQIRTATNHLQTVIDSLKKAVNNELRAELSKKLVEQSKQIDELKTSKEELAILLARINLNEASELSNLALQKFKEGGDVKAALTILSDEKLDKFWQILSEQEEKLKRAKNQGIENYILRARFLIADLRFQEGAIAYKKAISKDSTNIDNLWEAARFFNNQRELLLAIKLYEKILKLGISELEEALLLNNLIGLYADTGKKMAAEQAAKRALTILKKLPSQPLIFQEYLAMTLNNKGRFDAIHFRSDSAEIALVNALRISRNLVFQDSTFLPILATTLSNLGDFYFALKNYKNAEHYYLEVLSIRRKVRIKTPDSSPHELALALFNLGTYYNHIKQLDTAGKYLIESLGIFSTLSQKNPEAYQFYVAGTLSSLGDCFRLSNDFNEAEQYYLRSIAAFKPLLIKFPVVYFEQVIITLNNLGECYFDQKNYLKAEQTFNEALAILNELHLKELTQESLGITQYNLANLYNAVQQFDLAEKNAISALSIFESISLKNKEAYSLHIVGLLNTLSFLFLGQDNPVKGEQILVKALMKLDTLSSEKPEAFLPLKAQVLKNAGIFLIKIGKLIDAQKAFMQSISLYAKLILENNANYSDELTQVIINFKDNRDSLFLQNKQANIIQMTEFLIQTLENPNLRIEIANSENIAGQYGFLAWRYLLVRNYQLALACAEKSLKLDSNQKWLNSALAFSLLLNGELEQAETIFNRFKEAHFEGNRKLKELFLEDLYTLEKAGISHPNFKKVVRLLK